MPRAVLTEEEQKQGLDLRKEITVWMRTKQEWLEEQIAALNPADEGYVEEVARLEEEANNTYNPEVQRCYAKLNNLILSIKERLNIKNQSIIIDWEAGEIRW